MEYQSFNYNNAFTEKRYTDIINAWKSSGFVPALEPLTANIVASAYFMLGDYQSCYDYLTSLESCFADDINFLSLFGSVSRRLGILDQAYLLLKKAIDLDSDRPSSNNNFANLLIDMGRFDEAQVLLDKLLADDPSYGDARTNMERLLNLRNSNSSLHKSKSNEFTVADPLLLAFASNEVKRSVSLLDSNVSKRSNAAIKLVDDLPVPQNSELALDQLKVAVKANLDSNHSFALEICRTLVASLGCHSGLYECAANSYIGLKHFSSAETCLLHSLGLGSQSFEVFLNLSSLSLIRGDKNLAEYYYSRAVSLEPDDSRLGSFRASIDQVSQRFAFSLDWSESYPTDISSKKS